LHKPPGNDFPAAAIDPRKPGNGADAAPQVSVGTLIRLMAAIHPEWGAERLAKESGQPVSIVKRTLARKPRTSPAGAH
jgi:hypothetical protein